MLYNSMIRVKDENHYCFVSYTSICFIQKSEWTQQRNELFFLITLVLFIERIQCYLVRMMKL
jgi:hypothetical protein